MVAITESLEIPDEELSYQASRSSGPGGQNVNKVETRVTLRFDVVASPSLSEPQKAVIRRRLATRINKAGVLRVVSQRHRTQAANREAAKEKFIDLMQRALARRRPRRATAPSLRDKERRLEEKRRRAELKRGRHAPRGWDD